MKEAVTVATGKRIFTDQWVYIKVFEIYTFSFRSNLISKKSLIWFIMISPAKFQPPNPCITATNGIPRF
jgi:hypothetical protein